MTTETITLRRATLADVDQLGALVAQLYRAELPGVLRGPPAEQLRLFRHIVGHELAAGERGRYLAVAPSGQILGTGSIRLADGGGAPPAPLVSAAISALGLPGAARFLFAGARVALLADPPPRPAEGFIYSVVVDERFRGQGVGAQLMGGLEGAARQAGARTAALRVIVGNHGARRLYERLGYRVVGRSPRWADRIGIPTELMRKELA